MSDNDILKIEIRSTLKDSDGAVLHTEMSEFSSSSIRNPISFVRNILYRFTEENNRRALIHMGWTPPEESENQKEQQTKTDS